MSRAALGARLGDHISLHGCPVVSPADPRVPASVECAQDFGRVLAQFHAAADSFARPEDAAWTDLRPRSLVGANPTWVSRLYAESPDDERLLLDWWDRAHRVLSAGTGGDLGMCHGEAYPATCRDVDGSLAIAELDWVGRGDRTYDLATYRWVLAVHAEDAADTIFTAFVTAYSEIRAAPALEGLRAWVAARHLWSLRLAAGFADETGLARRAAFAGRWPIEG
jgi:Ser/Thr protein kinase RdoA (MazF antagonist)